ncbi:MAG: low molecular weight protein-tyrosine-phosphatase [Verrucomicrobiota bacterium]
MPAPPDRVLIVCMGNICRSPTAEAVLRAGLLKSNLSISVDSAGTEDYHVGSMPDARSIRHAEMRGYDLCGIRARQVQDSDFHDFDLILAADSANLAILKQRCPAELHYKLSLFLGDKPLPDPYYGQGDGFERVLDLVETRVEELISLWSAKD